MGCNFWVYILDAKGEDGKGMFGVMNTFKSGTAFRRNRRAIQGVEWIRTDVIIWLPVSTYGYLV